MEKIGTATKNNEIYILFRHGKDDFAIAAHYGDWSLRGSKKDVEEELSEHGLSFDNFQQSKPQAKQ